MSELIQEVISSRHGIAAKTKRKHQNHKVIPEGVKQQNHHAETRDPPSQDPRDHMAQAITA